MKIISIDIHANKHSNVYDGALHSFSLGELRKYLQQLKAGGEKTVVLVNAPITGYAEELESVSSFSAVTKRAVEFFFMNKGFGYSTTRVSGVQVTKFASLTYWTIIQNLFSINLSKNSHSKKFVPVFRRSHVSGKRINLVETHSHVALWLLENKNSGWTLAEKKSNFPKFRDDFCNNLDVEVEGPLMRALRSTSSGDQFNTVFGYLLCQLWLNKEANVTILGNRYSGGLLLPANEDLIFCFKFFAHTMYLDHLRNLAPTVTKGQEKVLHTELVDSSDTKDKSLKSSRPADPEYKSPGPGNCVATKHAFQRAKERLNWSKKTLKRLINQIEQEGDRYNDPKGKLRRFVKEQNADHGSGTKLRLHGENLFIFDGYLLITIYKVDDYLLSYISVKNAR